MPKKPKSKSPSESAASKTDYEQVGRAIEAIFITGHYDKFRLYRMSFVRGVFQGLGSVIGATIVIAILLWVLSLLESLPLIGDLFETAQETVETRDNDIDL